jgi:DNA-directed RNA polymerase subunit RPC12/RpoP
MSLIKCSECQREVSDQADFCPHCGNSIKPFLVERTSKTWKLAKLISWIIILLGVCMFFYSYGHGGFHNKWIDLNLDIIFIGFICLIISKFCSWWNHN